MTGEQARDSSIQEGTGRRRALPLCLGLFLAVVWFVFGAALAVGVVALQGRAARDNLEGAATALASGDLGTAQGDLLTARVRNVVMNVAADSPPLSILGVVPPTKDDVSDLNHLVSAFTRAVGVSDSLVSIYSEASSGEDGALFSAGRVDLDRLRGINESLGGVAAELANAQTDLKSVQTGPGGTAALQSARDQAFAQLEPLQSAVEQARGVLRALPDAMGSSTPKRYLVTMLNEGETRASGGAPLSVAVVRFQDGALDIPFKGAVAQVPWPGQGQQYGVLHWQGAPRSPWNRPEGQRVDRFANANFAADFRSAGYDLAAAWAAGGYGQVDGVIALDVTALASILRRTGPIAESPYGELTADNIGQKLLIDSYRDFADDQTARQTANQIIVSAVFQRLTTPASAFQVASALAEETPGRHVQVWFRDAALAASAHALRVDGAIADDSRDQAGLFSQNGNSSKADIFQVRQYGIDATVAADGSAAVVQTLRVRQAIPESLSVDGMTGYLAGWLNGSWFVLSPPEAVNPRLAIPDDWLRGRWPAEGVWVDDGYGHLLQRVEGAVPPGQQVDLTLTYTLPAGTFTEPDGSLVYRLDIEPQPIWGPVAARVTVVGPSGQQVVQEQLVDGRVAVALPIR